jgi:teichuronic acid biosynthesis glycosyltransferase TuaC
LSDALPRLLTFSSLFPSSARPQHGLFVAARLRELRRRHGVQAEVLAPVPWFPFRHARFGDYARWASTPTFELWEGQSVAHPRYFMLPGMGMRWQPQSMARSALAWVRQRQAQGAVYDAVDAHYFYPDGVAAAALARHLRVPLIITARGSDLNLIGQDARARARMVAAAEQASACVGVSAALVQVLRDWGVAPSKLHVVRNGVDLERFQLLDRSTARQQVCGPLGLALDAPLLLSVGNLVELKGHALLIEAVHALRDALPSLQLLIAGEGPERTALQEQIERCGLQARVRLVGALPNSELAPWYSAADLKVLVSSREGLPNVLLEALACGTPVLATAVGGIPELVTESFLGGLLNERTVTALAQAIEYQLRAPVDRPRLRQHAKGFSWESSSDCLATVLGSLNTKSGAHHA